MLGLWVGSDRSLQEKVVLEKQIKTCLEKKVDKQDFKNFIKQKEGLPFLQATKIFKDEKYLTICYGHYGSDVLPKQKKTRQQCNQLLDEDVTVRLFAIQEAIPAFSCFPKDIKIDLFASWYRGGLSGSPKTIALMNQNKFLEASQEFLNNREYKTTKLHGIKKRMKQTSLKIKQLAEQ